MSSEEYNKMMSEGTRRIFAALSEYAAAMGFDCFPDERGENLPIIKFVQDGAFTVYINTYFSVPYSSYASTSDIIQGNYFHLFGGLAHTLDHIGPIGSSEVGPIARTAKESLVWAVLDSVRSRITLGIELYNRIGAVEYMTMVARRGDGAAPSSALVSLSRINTPEALNAVLAFLKDRSGPVRSSVAYSLGRFSVDPDTQIGALLELVEDANNYVSRAARASLERLDPKGD